MRSVVTFLCYLYGHIHNDLLCFVLFKREQEYRGSASDRALHSLLLETTLPGYELCLSIKYFFLLNITIFQEVMI
jgi:hypothetical protein